MNFREYVPFYKRNLKIALPIMLSQLGGAIVGLADSIMVGHLGTPELAAVSFANAVFMPGFVFVTGISLGSTPLIGPLFIQGKFKRSAIIFRESIALNAVMGCFICSLLWVLSLFMDKMGQEEEVIRLAIPYYRLLVYSLIPYIFFNVFRQFMEGIGDTKKAMYITILSNIINIVFNFFLIYGSFGFPKMGVNGAGIATLLSRIIMPILFLIIFLRTPYLNRYFYLFKATSFKIKEFIAIAKIGFPIASQMIIEMLTFSFSAIMVGWFGAVALAGHQIGSNATHTCYMLILGISSATTIRVSHQFGLRDFKAVRMAGIASFHIALFTNVLTALLLIIFRKQIPLLFTNDPAVIDMAAHLLIMGGIFQISDGLQGVAAGALRGIANVKVTFLYAAMSYILINIPIGYLLGVVFELGAIGIWIGFIFGLSIAAFLLLRRFLRLTKNMIEVDS